MILEAISEDEKNPLSDAIVHFYDDKDRWVLRGRWQGYDVKGRGYLDLPYAQRVNQNEDVGEQFTKTHEKLTRQQMRVIWDFLQEDGFELDEHIESTPSRRHE